MLKKNYNFSCQNLVLFQSKFVPRERNELKMEIKTMKILIIEDDPNERNAFIKCIESREDIELVATTDSDIEGLKYVTLTHPEGIILDLELNNSSSGNADALGFLEDLKTMKLDYEPIVIVTTHVNSKRTYDILHRNGVDLILYKDHPKYSCNHVLNNFINLRKLSSNKNVPLNQENTEENKISDLISRELDLIGVTAKLKGREYVHDAILYLINNENSKTNVTQYLTKKYKKSGTTITNGIQNAIIHAWRVSPIEDLEQHYTARVNYETGIPTPMEFIYYYVDKIKKMI